MEVYNAKSEYDAFGPWIYELNNKNQLPPLFSSHYRETNNALLLFEIPRNIERRSASMGMDLYDYVMGMYEDHIYLLERNDNTVLESKIPYGEIDMVEDFRGLLFGRLTLFTTGRKIEILYNTVSDDIITKAVKIIRNRYTKRSYVTVRKVFSLKPETEIRYMNFLNSMELNGDIFDDSAYQPFTVAITVNQSLLAKLINVVFKKVLLPSLHLLNSKELFIISRGRPFKQPGAVYSYALNYMPIEKIQDIQLVNDTAYSNLQRLNIRLDQYAPMFYLDAANKSAQEFYINLQNVI